MGLPKRGLFESGRIFEAMGNEKEWTTKLVILQITPRHIFTLSSPCMQAVGIYKEGGVSVYCGMACRTCMQQKIKNTWTTRWIIEGFGAQKKRGFPVFSF